MNKLAFDHPRGHLYSATDMDGPLIGAFAAGTIAVYTHRAPGKETSNEDSVAILPVGPTAGVIVLADGCGGMACGEVASQLAIEAIANAVRGQSEPQALRPAILDGFEAATHHVAELGGGAGTTLIAVELNEGMLRTYHVGDSQAIVTGGRGKLKLQTRCHSPVGYAVEAGMLTEQDAMEHEDRHLISNVIGDREAHIDIGLPRILATRDTLIVASDGLFDNLSLQETVELARKGAIHDVMRQLCERVGRRMRGDDTPAISKPDDLTVVLFRRTPAL